jgi:hypothetical protein
VHEEAKCVSQDYGRTWVKDGLPGSRVFRRKSVSEAAQRSGSCACCTNLTPDFTLDARFARGTVNFG